MSHKLRFWPKIAIFGLIWPNLAPGKMTIQSYKTIFGPTFSAILENLLEPFFRNVPKTAILAKNGHFWAHLAKFGQNDNFPQKRAQLSFYPYCPPTLYQVSEKSLERF